MATADWGFGKVEANVAAAQAAGKPGPFVVLLTTGAMNPVHKGHIGMVRKVAAAAVWAAGTHGTVVGAFLSPSHDLYLAGKFRGKGGYIPSATRVAMMDATLEKDPLMACGRWESRVPGRWPDFPEVCTQLAAALKAQFPSVPMAVWYVCGEDHFTKCHLHHGVAHDVGVCVVARAGKKPDMKQADPSKVVAVEAQDDTDDMSSTAVREHMAALLRMLPPEALPLLFQQQPPAAK